MDKHFYEKVFSTQRMERYFNRYPNDEQKVITHYNLKLSMNTAPRWRGRHARVFKT